MSTHILGEPAPAQPPAAPGDSHRRPPLPVRVMHTFRQWRKGRPFVGGLLAILAGVELLSAPLTSLGVMIHEGVAGFSASFFGPLLVVFGLAIWFAPAYRLFAGIASILLGLIALPTINLGGFFIGTLLALIGGALSASWTPRPGWQAPSRRERRREQQSAAVPPFGWTDTGTMNAETAETSESTAVPPFGWTAEGTMNTQTAEIDGVQAAPTGTAPAEVTPAESETAASAPAEADPEPEQSGSTEESGAQLEE